MLPAKIIIGKSPVSTNADGLISLTDLWKAAGAVSHRQPAKWLSNDVAQDFVNQVAKMSKSPKSEVLTRKPGAGGGTFAHWQIALAYAKYLSPELHMAVNEVFMRYKAGDPALAEEVIREELNVQAVLVHSVTTTNRTTAWGCWL